MFDLAALEADGAGTTRREHQPYGRPYTDDGEHLNAGAQQIMAAALVRFLGALALPPAQSAVRRATERTRMAASSWSRLQ